MVETRIERTTKLLRKKAQPARPIPLNRFGLGMGSLTPDPSAANHLVSVIEDAGLSGSHGPSGCMQADCGGLLRSGSDRGGRAGVVVPDLGRAFEGFGRLVPRNPVAVVDSEFGAVELRFVADDDSVVGRVQFDDVQRMGGGNPEAFALADGVEFDAVVVSENPALSVHDFAGVPLHKFRLF